MSTEVLAGRTDNDLYLAIRTERLLSSHVAVVSRSDGEACGVVVITEKGLVFQPCTPAQGDTAGRRESIRIDGAVNRALTTFECRLPLSLFPDCRTEGIRVGLGMGGKHTPPEGRPVTFIFSSLSVAEVGPSLDRTFKVRLAVAPTGQVTKIGPSSLAPGQSQVVTFPAERGEIGPQRDWKITVEEEGEYVLHLFRYDPLERSLSLAEAMLDRLAAKGLDVREERGRAAELRQRQRAIAASEPNVAVERRSYFEARTFKRNLFFRNPELAPLEKILFVKRHAYEPSHNYSVMLDSLWRPGGGVCLLSIPRRSSGGLAPDQAVVTELFSSGSGISRDPVAAFDRDKIYYAFRPSPNEYYHLMSMNLDGSGCERLTSGPFHDYWPTPLPDGGLAFISTRCRSRYLCWRPQAAVLFRMDRDGSNIEPLSFANLSEWGPSVTRDGRILWTRSEYIDKGADFSHTLWTIRPDGTLPELMFGNTIIQPNGYANGREVPGSQEVCCTLISHFGDLNGPIALLDIAKGRFNPKAITSITPEVPWPGMWPDEECFRDPLPVARDYFLCSHAPRREFGLFVIDRYGNREVLCQDLTIGSMCPTLFRSAAPPPLLAPAARDEEAGPRVGVPALAGDGTKSEKGKPPGGGAPTGRRMGPSPAAVGPLPGEQPMGQFALADVYQGIEAVVPRGTVKYLRVVEEVRANLQQLTDGSFRKDHEPFMHFYAAPVNVVTSPFGWPSYVAKAPWGTVPVEEDGSAHFWAPAGKTLYFQALDKDLNEIQRMRSVVQLQPGEKRSCIGCHEDRRRAGRSPRHRDAPTAERVGASTVGRRPILLRRSGPAGVGRQVRRLPPCGRSAKNRFERHARREPRAGLVPYARPTGLGPPARLRLEFGRQRGAPAAHVRHSKEPALEGPRRRPRPLRREAHARPDARREVLDRPQLPAMARLSGANDAVRTTLRRPSPGRENCR